MAEKKNILTYAGLKQYEDELQNLKVVKRKEVAQKIKEAREQGDLSENAEYDAAKDEQRDIELRIEELEKLLKELLHGVADLTIDLREMDYLSSDGLRVFADAQKTMNKQGFMRVIHVNDKIMKIFEVNGFVDILTIEE